jgi:nitroreductase
VDVYEALYTTRMMRRMRADEIPREVQARILDAAIRAPNGGNAQRWHFLVVDDRQVKSELAALYQTCREREYEEIAAELGVPAKDGWRLTAMLALGYPLGPWGVAANRRPVHEVSSRNQWHQPFGVEVPSPLWPPT